MKNKKGTVTMYLVFMVLAIIIILISAVFAPMGVLFNAKMYEAGEGILTSSYYNDTINGIENTEIKAQLQDIMDSADQNAANNIEINAMLFEYGWILVISLTAIIIFLYTRRTVEYSGGLV